MVRANEISKWKDIENGDWKFLNIDEKTGELIVPKGTMGYRWDKDGGKWNMKFECGETEKNYDPVLTNLNNNDGVLQTEFIEYGLDNKFLRGVPVKYLDTVKWKNSGRHHL